MERRTRFFRYARGPLIGLAAGAGAVFLLSVSGIGCPIRHFIGIPCPACGFFRALKSLAGLDFAGYARFNPMALPVLIAVLLSFISPFLKARGKRGVLFFQLFSAALTAGLYVWRLAAGTIP